MKNVVSKSSTIVVVLCALVSIACNNNLNPGTEVAKAAPDGVVEKVAEVTNKLPAEIADAFEGSTLIVQIGGEGIYSTEGVYLGNEKTTWCDSAGVCWSDTQAGQFQTMSGALQSKEELTSFLAPGELAIGNCAPVGGTMCAVSGNYTVGGLDYTGRISCNLVRVEGQAFMRAYAVACEGDTECQMIGSYPVFGLCTKCSDAADCDDGNVCTNDGCNSVGKCVYTNNLNPCPNGDLCDGNEMCSAGACVKGTSLNCGDTNVCTNDSCAPATGCVNAANTIPCDDGSACTLGDVCLNTQCKAGGLTQDCSDGKVCTTDTCSAASGCQSTQIGDTVACDDGNACTLLSECSAGACVTTTPKSCDDGNLCTLDACDQASGACSYSNEANGKACGTGNECLTGACVASNLICPTSGETACLANLVIGSMVHAECKFAAGATKGTWTAKTVCGPVNSLCAPITGCGTPAPSEADCADGVDNDADGSTDCADSNCSGNAACVACANSAGCDDGNACTTDSCTNGFCKRVVVTCSGAATCNPSTGCPQPCTPSCSGKQCGSNGCGGVCGTCASGFSCDATSQCVTAPSVDQFSSTWVKPSQGVPADVAKFVLATECKLGSTIKIPFHYLLTDADSVVVNATANSVNFTKVVSGLKGSACKSNVFGYNSAGVAIWYAVMDASLTTVGTLSYSYNGASVSSVGVGSNGAGGGDYMWVIP